MHLTDPTEKQRALDQMFKLVDKDGDGNVTEDEFTEVYTKVTTLPPANDICAHAIHLHSLFPTLSSADPRP